MMVEPAFHHLTMMAVLVTEAAAATMMEAVEVVVAGTGPVDFSSSPSLLS